MKTRSFVASGRVAACAALLMAGVSVAFVQAADERPWVNLLPGGAYQEHWTNHRQLADGRRRRESSRRARVKGAGRAGAPYLWSEEGVPGLRDPVRLQGREKGQQRLLLPRGRQEQPRGHRHRGADLRLARQARQQAERPRLRRRHTGHCAEEERRQAAGGVEPVSHHQPERQADGEAQRRGGERGGLDEGAAGKAGRKRGPIGFQDHALPVWLKDIKIREL